MKEYNNFYEREDIYFMATDPLANYELQKIILRARDLFPMDTQKQKEMVKRECAYYWPTEIADPEIIRRAGLQERTKEAMKNVYKEFRIRPSHSISVLVKAFYYQDKKWFYWWDMYKNSQLTGSGLEFFLWLGHPASYLIFATEQNQSPLLYGESFKGIRQ